ncbi:MAG: hypothetical protein OEO19_20045 [Gammaproteobacteria bacterium]|nr:hypothetical protein [Gammaproteobacteria bacterium]MDH3449262.1 hypothetical protein [Gammaproteobacteria bacterium]
MDKESALFYVVLLLFAATGIVTLLGLVQKVAIDRKYLNALFAALVLELVAAVLYLFSDTDFFGPQPGGDRLIVPRSELPAAQRDMSAQEIVAMLSTVAENRNTLAQMERELASLKDIIAVQVPPYEDVTLALDARIREIAELQGSLEALRSKQAGFQKMRKNFLVRMADLNAKISELGGTVNFNWQPEEKSEIAAMLQSAFKQIGFMPDDEQPNDDPGRALGLLVDYQRAKNFGTTGFLTSQVVALIILDYLSPFSSNRSGYANSENSER